MTAVFHVVRPSIRRPCRRPFRPRLRQHHLRRRLRRVPYGRCPSVARWCFLRRFAVASSLESSSPSLNSGWGWWSPFGFKKDPDYSDEDEGDPVDEEEVDPVVDCCHVVSFEQRISDFVRSFDPSSTFRQLVQLQHLGVTRKSKRKKKSVTASVFIAARNLRGNYSDSFDSSGRLSSEMTVYWCKHEDEPPIVIDTGASVSLSPRPEDFIGPIQPPSIKSLQGLKGSVNIVGEGTVEWKIRDVLGQTRTIRTKAFYVPTASVRLFSPQSYFKEHRDGCVVLDRFGTKLHLPDESILEFPFQANNLPFMLTERHFDSKIPDVSLGKTDMAMLSTVTDWSGCLNVADDANVNLKPSQRELLLWHQKFNHCDMQRIQSLCVELDDHPQILLPKDKHVSSCVRPLCATCQFANQGRRSPEVKLNIPIKPPQLRSGDLVPGARVSLDQHMSSAHGRLPHTKGKEKTSKKFTGGTLFYDHASAHIFLVHQVSLRTGETIEAKRTYERFHFGHGNQVKAYHADNKPFGDDAFVKAVEDDGQSLTFSGVGAHHQNAVAERAIRTVTYWARAAMLHSIIHWPESANVELWPFAMDHAVYIWNNLPGKRNKLAPIEILSHSKFDNHLHLQRAHVWGCPVCVLDPALQDGKKLPKWKPRSRRGQFMGFSPSHSSRVANVLHLVTGFVSPQFHVVFDDLFSTVATDGVHTDHFDAISWNRLIESGYEADVWGVERDADGNLLAEPPPLDESWLTDHERRHRQRIRTTRPPRRLLPLPQLPRGNEGALAPADEGATIQGNEGAAAPEPAHVPQPEPETPEQLPTVEDGENSLTFENMDFDFVDDVDDDDDAIPQDIRDAAEKLLDLPPLEEPDDSPSPIRTRSGRITGRRNPRLIETIEGRKVNLSLVTSNNGKQILEGCSDFPDVSRRKVRAGVFQYPAIHSMDWNVLYHDCESGGLLRALVQQEAYNTDEEWNTIEDMHPLTFITKARSEDQPRWHEAMNGPFRDKWWEAAEKEIATLERMEVWDVVPLEDWMHVIPSTFAFLIKRNPDLVIKKFKARFCARGDRQIEGVDCFETFAPVVNWHTIRMLLVMSIILPLVSMQVDYTAAFVTAPIDLPPNYDELSDLEKARVGVFVRMPQGFAKPGMVLKLKKSLYGLKNSPRNFWLYLKGKLLEIGFNQSDHDACLFYSESVICLVYVDDTLFFAQRQSDIDAAVTKLREASELEITVEDDVAGFLGVMINRHKDGRIELTQRGLIERVITALDLGNRKPTSTPAKPGALGSDKDGLEAQGTYNYRSVCGMLLYLSGHSRPDIHFAVTQCCRYGHNPKRSHEEALEHLGLCLKGTKDKGLIVSPENVDSLRIDMFVDADFAGMWGHEHPQDPACAKSRTGFVIFIANCPILWVSKMQDTIACSSQESEYSALSMGMRDLLPIRYLMLEFCKQLQLTEIDVARVCKTTVHEDNQGCLRLASLEPGRMTPRSKFYAVKHHWFRSKILPNRIEIIYVPTLEQRADLLTKALQGSLFQGNRKLTCGW